MADSMASWTLLFSQWLNPEISSQLAWAQYCGCKLHPGNTHLWEDACEVGHTFLKEFGAQPLDTISRATLDVKQVLDEVTKACSSLHPIESRAADSVCVCAIWLRQPAVASKESRSLATSPTRFDVRPSSLGVACTSATLDDEQRLGEVMLTPVNFEFV